MATSLIPGVIDALVTALTAAVDSAVQVLDGPPKTNLENDYLAVGLGDNALSPVAVAQQEPAGLGNRRRNESVQVMCQASTFNGDGDMQAARNRVFVIFGLAETYLRDNGNLGGVIFAEIASCTLQQIQMSGDPDTESLGGALATVDFVVAVRFSRI